MTHHPRWESLERLDRLPAMSVFEAIGRLLIPAASDHHAAIIEAGPLWEWDVSAAVEASTIIWGAAPASGGNLRARVPWSRARERALAMVDRQIPADMALRRVHRLLPGQRSRRLTNAVRRHLLGGAAVEIGHDARAEESVLDAVARSAGTTRPADPLRPSRDGSLVAFAVRAGEPCLLRVAVVGSGKHAARNAAALAEMAPIADEAIPQLIGHGTTAGASWSVESLVAGRIPSKLTRGLLLDTIRFVDRLPSGESPATSPSDRLRALAGLVPRCRDALSALARRCEQLTPRWPSCLAHGDLWLGNLLVARGRLVGVVDWDTWHPRGVPGSDLLQLVGMQSRARTGHDLGILWRDRFWQAEEVRRTCAAYLKMKGLTPSPDLEWLTAVDWWAGQVLKRRRRLSNDRWIDENVVRVLSDIAS